MQDTVSFWMKYLRIRPVIQEESGQQHQNHIQMWYEDQYTHTIYTLAIPINDLKILRIVPAYRTERRHVPLRRLSALLVGNGWMSGPLMTKGQWMREVGFLTYRVAKRLKKIIVR